jgi:hypothetical protein
VEEQGTSFRPRPVMVRTSLITFTLSACSYFLSFTVNSTCLAAAGAALASAANHGRANDKTGQHILASKPKSRYAPSAFPSSLGNEHTGRSSSRRRSSATTTTATTEAAERHVTGETENALPPCNVQHAIRRGAKRRMQKELEQGVGSGRCAKR